MRPSRGECVLIVKDNETCRRKILWVGDNSIEWRGGWAKISDLQMNPNQKSNRIILDLREKQK